MESYLNNNYYGNRSYGVAAAAQSYWKKDLSELTLAQYALLAGIPKSPTTYDLVQNAVEEEYEDENGKEQARLVVPQTTAGRAPPQPDPRAHEDTHGPHGRQVHRRRLRGGQGRARDPRRAGGGRAGARRTSCGRRARSWARSSAASAQCEKIDTGGYTVITSLDYKMQRITEKWVYAAAIIPNSKNPDTQLKDRQIPRREWSWIKDLRGHNIHNAAAGVIDYRTGEVLAYAGLGVVHGQGQQEDPAAVRRPRRTAGASPGRRSSRWSTSSASTTGR